MVLRTRNQFVVKTRSSERTHALPLHIHIRESDLPHFHAQEHDGINTIQILLQALDGDGAFQALVHELDNVRAVDDLIKTKGNTLFQIATAPQVQIQWYLEDRAHSLVNILERSQRDREEYFVKKKSRASTKQTEQQEEYIGGMLRALPVRKAAVTVWLYPPHVTIPPTGDRIPVDATVVTDFLPAEKLNELNGMMIS